MTQTITKADIIDELATNYHGARISKEVLKQMFADVQKKITDSVKTGENVSFYEFGTFKRTLHNAREGRNPQTGEKLHIDAKYAPSFKASSKLKKAIAEVRPE